MKTPDVSANPTTPLFGLTLESFEPVFKNWIKEVLNTSEPIPDSKPEYFTRIEVCKMLHLSLPTVDRYARMGILEGKKVGNRILFNKDSIEQALNIISKSKSRK